MAFIKISTDFSDSPGARYVTDGDNSGQEFRETHLEPLFLTDPSSKEIITVDLDDTDGYATSFLEEAFGGIARLMKEKHNINDISDRFKFVSNQEESLIEEIMKYISEANN